jgi:hypothetical protein
MGLRTIINAMKISAVRLACLRTGQGNRQKRFGVSGIFLVDIQSQQM